MISEELLDGFENDVLACYNSDELKQVYLNYDKYNYPYFGYLIADRFVTRFHDTTSAYSYYFKAIESVIQNTNKYFNYNEMHMISQSIFALLSFYDYRYFSQVHNKLFNMCYIFSTNYIINTKHTAIDTIKCRYDLLNNENIRELTMCMLREYYYAGDDICIEVLLVSDSLLCFHGYREEGLEDVSEEFKNKFHKEKNLIVSLPQYTKLNGASDKTFLQIGLKNHEYLYNKVVMDYEKGAFNVSESELKGLSRLIR